MSPVIIPLSKSLEVGFERLFKVGGFALAFGFGGFVLIIVASFAGGSLRVETFAAGCLFTLLCLIYFLATELRARKFSRRLKEDLPLLDALQSATLKVTELASLIQSLAFKHIDKVQRAIDVIVPVAEKVPVFTALIRRAGLSDLGNISKIIVDSTQGIKEIVSELEEAVRQGDLKRIRHFSVELEKALKITRSALEGN